jgi:uncharacterized phage protein gp47/JayE
VPTKEEIMERMFSNISNDYDKTEGSFIYDAVVAVATALEDGYIEMESIVDKAFAETAFDGYLDKIVAELGVYRKPATKATTTITVTGIEGTIVPLGARFFVESVYFATTESKTITSGTAFIPVECEIPGTIGNVPSNSIINFEPITGVTSSTNPNPVANGTDVETDKDLKQRYFEKVKTPSTSGNAQHYINWCKEVAGVGDAKVFPLWNGNGTVRCVIINSNKRAADASLISSVSSNVDGQRPIGATITVISATELAVNISVDIDLNTGYDLVTVKANITQALVDFFKDIAFKSDYASYALIGSKVLDVDGVVDYRNLTLNGGTANVSIGSTQVAVVGTVNVT